MKHDAFDDVHCPFNYPDELEEAREALNAKVGTYISENAATGYRELAKQFGISPATLCAIAKKYSRKRKPGRRSRNRKITFDVRHKIHEKEFMTKVTVLAADARNVSVSSIRSMVATYYKTNDIKTSVTLRLSGTSNSPSESFTSLSPARPHSRRRRDSVCHNLPMCGRYRLSRRKQLVEEYFDTTPWDEEWSPHYNIAPTQPVPVIRQHPRETVRQLSLMKWGLIPHWARDASIATGTINAKSETAATKPAFRDPLKYRRCLVPADAFYEWKRHGASKQPFCFEVKDGELFAFAGLWDGWKDSSGQWVKTCSILTTTPNAVTSAIHDRMPVILEPESYDLWLDPGMQNVAAISELLKPYDARLMRCYPVSSRVNHVANDDEECSRPVALAETQHRLFG